MPANASPKRTFTVVVTGDFEIGHPHYPFVAGKLCSLLAERVPHVRVLSGGTLGADALGERWAIAHNLQLERFEPPPPPIRRSLEILRVEWLLHAKPDCVVVFGCRASDMRLSELKRLARARDIPVRGARCRRRPTAAVNSTQRTNIEKCSPDGPTCRIGDRSLSPHTPQHPSCAGPFEVIR
jgi:hypothetical protein